MNNSSLPLPGQIDELLVFLSNFKVEGFDPFLRQPGLHLALHGGLQSTPPEYKPEVIEFFGLIAQDCWLDHDYKPKDVSIKLSDGKSISSAKLSDLRSMLTWCLRGERFSEGHCGNVITNGSLLKILERLKTLRDEM